MFFDIFYLIPIVIFTLIAGVIIFKIISGISTWVTNNNSEKITTSARIVAKRSNINHSSNMNTNSSHSTTTYYITFELQSGHRQEFQIKTKDYALLAEQDLGTLTYQGTRFLSFDRSF